ncbi:hypothetical protein L9F63_009249 [Diploptera punctata]|uniref:C2H2-type domain-containing protein n=1 Tax=Diploptera punctata TaxID=6984 RepID=A0AAD8ESI2_DIPPU|nr:hypothetical protein L9F63_009249 [Diploptera punctata]
MVCGRSFTLKKDLSDHARIHNNEKPFKCSFCDKLFSRNTDLNRHSRIHNREKMFRCSECHKCSLVKDALTVHLMFTTIINNKLQ